MGQQDNTPNALGNPNGRQHIGAVAAISGTASVTRAKGAAIKLRADDRIHIDDIIETAGRSWLTIALADGTLFTISQHGRFSLDEFYFDLRSEGGLLDIWVMEGTFTVTGGMIMRHKEADAVIRTRDATLVLPGPGGALAGKVSAADRVTLFTLLAEDDGTVGHARVETDVGCVLMATEREISVVTSPERMPSMPMVMTEADLFDLFGAFRDRGRHFAVKVASGMVPSGPGDLILRDGSNDMPVWDVPPVRLSR